MHTQRLSIRDICISCISSISSLQISSILIAFISLQPLFGFTHNEELNFIKHIVLRIFVLLILIYTLFYHSYSSRKIFLPRIGIEKQLLLYWAGILVPTCIALGGEIASFGRSMTSLATVPLMISLLYLIAYWIHDTAAIKTVFKYFVLSVFIVCIIGLTEYVLDVAIQFTPSGRIRSVFVDPNIFARYVLFGIFIILPLMIWKDYTIFSKKTLFVFIIFFITNLLLSLSRSGYLALLAGLVILSFYMESKKYKVMVFIGTCVVAIIIFAFLLTQRTFTGSALIDPSNINRIHLIQGGIEMIENHWLTGVGYTNFANYFERNYLENFLSISTETYKYAGYATEIHNWMIEILAEQGIFGLGIFVLLFWKILSRIHFAWKIETNTTLRCLLISGILIVFTFLFHGFFYHTFISQFFFWTVLGFIISLSKISLITSGRFNG